MPRRRAGASTPTTPEGTAVVWAEVWLPGLTLIVTEGELYRVDAAGGVDSWTFDDLDAVVADGSGQRFLVLTRSGIDPINVVIGGHPGEEENRQALTVLQLLLARHQRRRDQRQTNAFHG